MALSTVVTNLWKQMIHNLNHPDWASRHLADDVSSAALLPGEGISDGAGSSLEMALSQIGLLRRPSDLLPPQHKS